MKKQIGIAAMMIAVGAAAGVVASHASAQIKLTPTIASPAVPLVKDANGVVLGRLAGITYTGSGIDERPGRFMFLTSAGYLVTYDMGSAAPVASGVTILYGASNCTGATYVSVAGSHLSFGTGKVAVFNMTTPGKWMAATGPAAYTGPQSFKTSTGCSPLTAGSPGSAPYYPIVQPSTAELGLPATSPSPLRIE